MIVLISKCYLILLFSILLPIIFILIVGLTLIFKRSKKIEAAGPSRDKARPVQNDKSLTLVPQPLMITSEDIKSIAGEDIIATQLDLARAYLETGRQRLASRILAYVAEKGTASQKKEAERLLADAER